MMATRRIGFTRIDVCDGEYECTEKPTVFYIIKQSAFKNLNLLNTLPYGRCAKHAMEMRFRLYYDVISYEEAVTYEIMQS
jgi:hypothetical protein